MINLTYKFSLALISILIIGTNNHYADDFLNNIPESLPDGVYQVTRTHPFEKRGFDTEEEALAWMEEFKKNPKPFLDFLEVHISGDDFVIRALEPAPDGNGFVPKGNLFASISDEGSWLYQQSGMVTLLEDRFQPGDDAGHMTGMLRVSANMVREVRLMGFHPIDWSSVVRHEAYQISGTTFQGKSFTGIVNRNSEGGVGGITYTEEGGDQYNIEIVERSPDGYISNTSITQWNPTTESWDAAIEYQINSVSHLPNNFDPFTFWKQFSDPETFVVRYDTHSQNLLYKDELGQTQSLQSQIDAKPSDISTVGVILILTGIALPLLILFGVSCTRSRNAKKT